MSAGLLDRIKAGARNTRTIKFPGTDQDVMIRILSRAQIQEARFAADETFRKRGIEPGLMTADEYEEERTNQMLYLALRDPADPAAPIAPSVSAFKAQVTLDELDALAAAYRAFEHECSPDPEQLSATELSALIEDLKKTPEQTAGSVSSIAIARQLLASLASRLEISPKDNGSTST